MFELVFNALSMILIDHLVVMVTSTLCFLFRSLAFLEYLFTSALSSSSALQSKIR